MTPHTLLGARIAHLALPEQIDRQEKLALAIGSLDACHDIMRTLRARAAHPRAFKLEKERAEHLRAIAHRLSAEAWAT